MRFEILDTRGNWHDAAVATAKRRGYDARRITSADAMRDGPGIGFIRPHAHPETLEINQLIDYPAMAESGLTMIQDIHQVMCYESKSLQHARWGAWMPETIVTACEETAKAWCEGQACQIVSKADEGASSKNVRVITKLDDQISHIEEVFSKGVTVHHCDSQGTTSIQKDYVILQRFIPHAVTYRVNVIGRGRAIFRRFNHADRPVAQTGNVEPVMALDADMESLLDFADRFAAEAGTKWCALDILRDGDQWRLLETSLAWPWPSPGKCNEAPIFRTGRKWADMWDALFDEVEAGQWGELK